MFITFTANLSWLEIKEALKDFPKQEAIDHPDIVACVFRLRQKKMVQKLKQDLFACFWGCVWTIEYQKQGLSHMHLLLFLHPENCFLNTDKIDQIISVELSDPNLDQDRSLTNIIKSQMIHSPCESQKPDALCMAKDSKSELIKYSKRFPRSFQKDTKVEEDRYPVYQRQNDRRI